MTTAAELDLSSLDKDPRLFLYTSLTAGSSHIVSATSRMETILKANRIPFLAVDLATDEKCRRLWQRRGGAKKKLPGLVKEGYILGDLEEVEEWNEFGELKENIGPVPPSTTAPPGAHVGVSTAPPLSANVTAAQGDKQKVPQSGFDKTKAIALPGAEEMAAIHKAKKANDAAAASAVAAAAHSPASTEPVPPNTSLDEKTESVQNDTSAATEITPELKEEEPQATEQTQESIKEEVKATEIPQEVKKENIAPKEPKKEDESSQEPKKDDGPPQDSKKYEDPPTEGVASLQVKEDGAPSKDTQVDVPSGDETTQEQSAKDPEAAGKSVVD